ncbi:MAG TPA: hypothetical protein VKA26_01140 [Ignavibacteriaceae bacterium]|nr:hypothetical protein [Ignavibacteriaceae bacterium]
MIAKVRMYSTVLFLTIFLTGFISPPVSTVSKSTALVVMKVNDVWMVVDAADKNNTKIKVKKKDTIIWEVEDTDAYFQFPAEIFDPVDQTDSLVNGYTKFIKDGHKLKLKIKGDAPSGTYEYAVFCTADGVFAKGGSPPKIVVE